MIRPAADITQRAVDPVLHYQRLIEQRTGSRVSRLGVEVNDGQIIIRGRSGSYYIKQLAQESLLDIAGDAGCEIVNEIEVGPGKPLRP